MNDATARTDTAPSIALLPCTGDSAPRNLPRAGIWIEFPGFRQLHSLATGMTRGKQVIRLADVTALPDAWGQAVCFHAAFHNREHVLHDTAIAEWRGLLALIALSQLRNIDLCANPIDLDALADNPRGAGKSRLPEGTANFGAAVKDSFPNFIDPMDKDRLQIDVLLCGNEQTGQVPVGFTFDKTLVVPGRDYSRAFSREAIPWGTWEKDSGGCPLHDPSPVSELTEPWQRDALRQWLERLRKTVREDGVGINDLIEELSRFIDDLGTDNGKQQMFHWIDLDQPLPSRRKIIQAVLTVPSDTASSKRPFAYKNTATSPAASHILPQATASATLNRDGMPAYMSTTKNPPPPTLEVALRASILGFSLKGAIIIDPQPQSLEEWGDIEIRPISKSIDLLRKGADRNKVNDLLSNWKDELQDIGWILLTPSDLFTENLTPLSTPTKFHQTGRTADWTNNYLLPFTPLVLALYEPNALRKAFRMSKDYKDGSIVIELDIPLAGTAADNESTLTLTKRYLEKAPVVPPARLTQWPNYVSSVWRHYYIDAHGGRGHTPIARVIAFDRLADMLKGLPSSQAVDCVYSWSSKGSVPLQVSSRNTGDLWRTCHLADRPVEAVMLVGADGLCLAQPIASKPVESVEDEFRIAIDFGSSGTQILALGGGRVIPSGPLEPKLSYIFSEEGPFILADDMVSREGAAVLLSSLAKRPPPFLPATEWKAPRTLSFIPLPGAQIQAAGQSLEHVSNVDRPEGFLNVRFGLKYGCKMDNVAPADDQWEDIESILRECALLAAAGVVRFGAKPENMKWAFAYPATFLASEKKKFEGICKAATLLPGRSPESAITDGDIDIAPAPLMVVEPRATYMFLRTRPRVRTDGIMISADVGGHSTDICISCRNKLVWAGSLALAGQHVFTDHLVFFPNSLNTIIKKEAADDFMKASAKVRDIASNNEDNALMVLRGFVEAMLSKFDTAKIKSKERTSEPAIRLFLHGLIHYICLILDRCREDQLIFEKEPVSLYFAGGGARFFFDWIGQEVCQNELNEALAARPWLGNATQVYYEAKNAKKEVAEGLHVAMTERRDAGWVEDSSLLEQSRLPLGEKVEVDSATTLDYLDVIPTSALEFPENIRLNSIEQFELFLKKAESNGVEISGINKATLFDRTCNAFEKEKRRGQEARKSRILSSGAGVGKTALIQLQPPFILALRACIEMMAREPS